MSDVVNYLRGKSLTDLAQDGLQTAGINAGYNPPMIVPSGMDKSTALGGPVGPPGALMGGFPVSLDDLKQWYMGVTNGNTWQRAADQLHIAGNAIHNYTQPDTSPTHGQPIQDPSMNLSDVWSKVAATLGISPGKGSTMPPNLSGIK